MINAKDNKDNSEYSQEMREKTDQEIVEISKSDPEFFGLIMERYKNPLFFYIKRISQFSNEDAEDILQEVFIKAYTHINGYDTSLKFSSWIYRIAHNHVVDNFRKLSSRPRTTAIEDEDIAKIFKSDIDIEKDLHNKENMERIRESIKKMPIKYREVLVLRFLEDKSYEEIMDILKRPKGTVATLLARGRKILEKDLKSNNIKLNT